MLQSSDEALQFLAEGQTLLGEGWTHVNDFDNLKENEYEEEEEEIYVTMDLGTTIDSKSLQNESQYQLVGLDTPLTFLKLGNQIFQGQITPLIGDEVILGLIRDSDNPHEPTHPPIYSTNHRLTFRAIAFESRTISNSSIQPTTSIPSVLWNSDKEKTYKEDEAGPSSHHFLSKSNNEKLGYSSEEPRFNSSVGGVSNKPRTQKARLIIERTEDLENFNLESIKTSQKVELGPEILKSLDIPPSTHGEPLMLSKTELSKVISGFPSNQNQSDNIQSSNKSKKSKKVWIVGEDGKMKLQKPTFTGDSSTVDSIVNDKDKDDIEMIEQGNSEIIDSTSSREDSIQQIQAQKQDQDQDQEMIDVENDPPWTELNDGNSTST
ncbi:uncharacterized protein I206_104896 [Kwoniella pini CBS 10737]|uniref:Transcription factor TFIIIC triple barrel domain-containing protein n=1 Tax=Kwoniella pini CBS 10737 TaxID=1296096 RepID=A0A1B9I8J7_9TREE|nr:uncharacterized protein I206_02436 [Kwoniella pini CBS 10737]OCF51721.1 hypothetical protein I206_02436 [Kwoniella pini CBS 10737]